MLSAFFKQMFYRKKWEHLGKYVSILKKKGTMKIKTTDYYHIKLIQ